MKKTTVELAIKSAGDSPYQNGVNTPTYMRAHDAFRDGFLEGWTAAKNCNRCKCNSVDCELCTD